MNAETLVKMKSMKFYGMARAFSSCLEDGQLATMTSDEMLSFLISSEYDDRHNRRIDRTIRNARFRYSGSIEKLYYGPERNLEKNQMMRYAECDFIDKAENILRKIINVALFMVLAIFTLFAIDQIWSVLVAYLTTGAEFADILFSILLVLIVQLLVGILRASKQVSGTGK